MSKEKVHQIISHIEQANGLVCYLQDTKNFTLDNSNGAETFYGYDLICNWVKEKLENAENLLYELLTDQNQPED